jgi:hypothetical protein
MMEAAIKKEDDGRSFGLAVMIWGEIEIAFA